MIFSKELTFSSGQNLTSTGESTNVIDLGAPGTVLGAPAALRQDVGKGRPIPIVVQLDADAADPSDTLDVDLEVDNDEAFGSAKVVASAQQLTGGVAGSRITLYYVPEGADERYMRLNYTLGGSAPDYTVTAGLVLADQTAP